MGEPGRHTRIDAILLEIDGLSRAEIIGLLARRREDGCFDLALFEEALVFAGEAPLTGSERAVFEGAPLPVDEGAGPEVGCVARADHRSVADEEPPETVDDPGTFGRYTEVREIGRGGMGRVLLGFDETVGRPIAIKVMSGQSIATRGQIRRFYREARVTGQLEHPNIPPLHEIGDHTTGPAYFTMKLVKGKSLRTILDEDGRAAASWTAARHDSRRRARLRDMLGVCDALEYAHGRRIVHRDIKPDNIMIGKFGEVQVMDWGVARLLDVEDDIEGEIEGEIESAPGAPPSLDGHTVIRVTGSAPGDGTAHGVIVGTPGYMPPEQIAGRVAETDRRSDVFALGATIHEVLCLEPPYRGALVQVAMGMSKGRPDRPSSRWPAARIPRELDELVHRAMAPDPSERYQDVAALRADIEAHLANRPLAAARYTTLERSRKWVRRNPVLSGSLALFLLVAVVGLPIYSVHAGSLRSRAEDAEATNEEERTRRARALEGARALEEELDVERRTGFEIARREFTTLWARLLADCDGYVQRAERQLRMKLAGGYLERFVEAYEQLFDTHRRYPDVVEVTADDYFYLAVLHMVGTRESAAAVRCLDEAIRMQPENWRFWVNRAQAKVGVGDLSGAEVDWDRGVELGGDLATILHNRSTAYLAAGDFERAVGACERLHQLAPDDPTVVCARGTIEMERSRWSEAIPYLDRAIELDPVHPLAFVNRAYCHLRLGDVSRAGRDLERALEIDQDDPSALATRAQLRGQAERWDLAARDLVRAIELDPLEPTYHSEMGFIQFRLENYDAAVRAFDEALELGKTGDAHLRYARGRSLMLCDRRADAIEAYGRSVRIDPDHWEARRELAFWLIASEPGDLEAGEEHIPPALASCPPEERTRVSQRFSYAFRRRGQWLAKEGRIDRAIEVYEKALIHNETNWGAIQDLARALVERGDRDEALVRLGGAARRAPAAHRKDIERLQDSIWTAEEATFATFESDHFRIATTLPPAYARTILDEAEAHHARCEAILGSLPEPPTGPFGIRVYHDALARGEDHDRDGHETASGAVVLSFVPSREFFLFQLRKALTIQYARAFAARVPLWLIYGTCHVLGSARPPHWLHSIAPLRRLDTTSITQAIEDVVGNGRDLRILRECLAWVLIHDATGKGRELLRACLKSLDRDGLPAENRERVGRVFFASELWRSGRLVMDLEQLLDSVPDHATLRVECQKHLRAGEYRQVLEKTESASVAGVPDPVIDLFRSRARSGLGDDEASLAEGCRGARSARNYHSCVIEAARVAMRCERFELARTLARWACTARDLEMVREAKEILQGSEEVGDSPGDDPGPTVFTWPIELGRVPTW